MAAGGSAFGAKTPAQRPNILIVLADNLGSWMLGCYGNKEIRTPNIDTFARTGMRFVHSFAASPAAPANRAVLLTGRSPRQHAENDTTLGDLLAKQGYTAGSATNLQQANVFLDQQNAGKPFFFLLEKIDPEGLPKYEEKYAGSKFDLIGWEPPAAIATEGRDLLKDPVASIRKAASRISALDETMGALLRKLQDRGLRDNTLVIFTSASGGLLGRHGIWADGLGSDPINMYEEAVQVPMIWSWPGKIPTDAITTELIAAYDFVPTLCDLTGAAPAKSLSGRSYWPLVTRQQLPKKQPWKNVVLAEFRDTGMARDTRFKLVLRNDGKGPNELFDLSTDPREKANKYADPQFVTVRERLTKELAVWRGRTG